MAWHQAVKQKETELKERDSQNHQTDFMIKIKGEFVLTTEVIKGNLERKKKKKKTQTFTRDQ